MSGVYTDWAIDYYERLEHHDIGDCAHCPGALIDLPGHGLIAYRDGQPHAHADCLRGWHLADQDRPAWDGEVGEPDDYLATFESAESARREDRWLREPYEQPAEVNLP